MKKIFFLALTAGLTKFGFVNAQNELKPLQINVFKNGTYFIVKEGNVKVKKNVAKLSIPDNPLLGTFWLSSTKDNPIKQVTFRNDTLKIAKTANSITEYLEANIGKNIKISCLLAEKTIKEYVGLLQQYQPENELLRLKSADGKTTFIHCTEIKEFGLEDKALETLTKDSIARLADMEFISKNDDAHLRMLYMQAGIQWLPSYFVRILDDKEVQLDLKALVENYAETVMDAELTLTVGNPQFTYGKMNDPAALGYLSSLIDSRPTGGLSLKDNNGMYQNYNYAPVVAQDISTSLESRSTSYNSLTEENLRFSLDGEKTNDLYMYSLGKVNLLKDSKTSFQIFSQKLGYKDVYEVTINDVVNYASNRYIANDPEARQDVFHSLRITNNTESPFTTGPAFVINEKQQPLAQDQIKYTPIGNDASIQLSKAGDVIVKNQEEEIRKVENYKKVGRNTYNKVTIKGTITITNAQKKSIDLRVKKYLSAEVLEVSDSGKSKKSGRYYNLNPYSEINWSIPVKENEKVQVTYTYDVLVFNN